MTGPVEKDDRLIQETVEEEILAWAKDFAEKNGYILNPDEKRLRTVIRGLARNQVKHGERYCPCRIRSGDQEKDRHIICPCVYHGKEIEEEGMCHCNLFFRRMKDGLVPVESKSVSGKEK
ncbi:MAG: ferredoxin:thioredoxin reductase [Methanoregulaceae archaeon]|nr:ferredoxin:thioredoxin reductase [Methanoregulaceae archaeon]